MDDMRFFAVAREIIDRIEKTQADNLRRVADLYARCIAADGLVHLWGAGHSAMGVQETFPRIGSIVGFHPLVELPVTYYTNVVGVSGLRQALFLERVTVMAKAVLKILDFGRKDGLVWTSSRGFIGVAREMPWERRSAECRW